MSDNLCMPNNKIRIAVLVSGGGTNLQALIDAQNNGKLKSGRIAHVISSSAGAYAIIRASNEGIPYTVIERKKYDTQLEFEDKIKTVLSENNIQLIVLAGFMNIFSINFTSQYPRRIINVHPSLIPSFCGKGYYGLRVHEAAINYGVRVTGATVHFVNEIPDGGEIILQKPVAVRKSDTPESLQRRIMEQAEWKILPRAVEMIAKKMLKIKESSNEYIRHLQYK